MIFFILFQKLIVVFFFLFFYSPGAIRAQNHKGDRLLLFVGIIDILQSYRLFKRVEHAWKALLHDGVSLKSSSRDGFIWN